MYYFGLGQVMLYKVLEHSVLVKFVKVAMSMRQDHFQPWSGNLWA